MSKYSFVCLLCILLNTAAPCQLPRLVGASSYTVIDPDNVLYQFDSTKYYYSGSRRGDLNAGEIKYDSALYLQWNFDGTYIENAAKKTHKSFDVLNNTLSLKSFQMQSGLWKLSGIQNYLYDNLNRQIKEVTLLTDHTVSGQNDTMIVVFYSYTNTNKIVTKKVVRYQANAPASIEDYTYTYNNNDSLVYLAGPNYSFEWVYDNSNNLIAYIQSTLSGNTANRYGYYANGYIRYATYIDNQFNFSNDSTFYLYNTNYDTAYITKVNLVNGAVSERISVFDTSRNVLVSITLAGIDTLSNDVMRVKTYNRQNLVITDTLFIKERLSGAYKPQQYQIFTYDTIGLITSDATYLVVDDTSVKSVLLTYMYNNYNQLTEIKRFSAPDNSWMLNLHQHWYYEYTSTGIEKTADSPSDILVFPNPSKGSVFIDLPVHELYDVSVYNLEGKNMLRLKNQTGLTRLDIACNEGTYLLVVTDSHKNAFSKLVINH